MVAVSFEVRECGRCKGPFIFVKIREEGIRPLSVLSDVYRDSNSFLLLLTGAVIRSGSLSNYSLQTQVFPLLNQTTSKQHNMGTDKL